MEEAQVSQEIKQLDNQVENAIEKALVGKYKKLAPVGRGTYGQVWQVERLADHKFFVAKVMSQEKKHRHEAEVLCLAKCDHFGVVKLFDSFQSDFGPIIVLEYADKNDLAVEIKSYQDKNKHLSENEVGLIFFQIVLAVFHLHSLRMLHRDIKAANVLLTKRGVVKLSDFGFSRQFEVTISNAVAETFLGTPYYLAPELWRRQKYGKKADVWSLGIILYEMITLKRPFVSNNMKGLMNCILAGEYEPPNPNLYNEAFLRLLSDMLQVDAQKRTTVAEVLRDPIMQKYWELFEQHVKNSTAITDAEKEEIKKNLAEAREALKAPESQSDIISDNDLTPQDIIHEGAIYIGSTKDWKPRYLVLTSNALIVTRVKEDRKSQHLLLDIILSVNPANSPSVDNIFVISLNSGYTVWLRASTPEERDQWISLITTAMANKANAQVKQQ